MELQQYQKDVLSYVEKIFTMENANPSKEDLEPRPLKLRVITKMAKNVNPCDLIDFPGYGWHEIGGWSQVDGVVSISAPGVPMLNFDMNERVRIQRRVLS